MHRRPQRPPKLLDEIFWPLALLLAHIQFGLSMYVQVMIAARPLDDPYLRPWKIARDATWLLVLVGGYLQFYFVDVFSQIASLPRLEVRV